LFTLSQNIGDGPIYFLKNYFGPQSFILSNLILIEGQLIWISKAMMELEE
jgi:hypothetical protein